MYCAKCHLSSTSSNFVEYVCAMFDFYNDIMYNPINTACRDKYKSFILCAQFIFIMNNNQLVCAIRQNIQG